VTGSHGLIGSALVARLEARGDEVVRLVRGPAGPAEARWDPLAGTVDTAALAGVGAVVHLAGAGVGDHRWSASYRRAITDSRVAGTATLARALAGMPAPPAVLLSGSAVGYYGVRGDEELTEDSSPGAGFLAEVCARWEEAAAPASAAGIRVVSLRFGIVLSAAGGALKPQLPLFRLGLGARLGSGRQQFSWVTRRDAIGALEFLLARTDLSGACNITSPAPATNREFTRALARALHRPALLAVPAPVLRAVAGRDMATEFFLASQRVLPQRLSGAGFTFADAELPGALVTALADRRGGVPIAT
jgi:hypothetical protein